MQFVDALEVYQQRRNGELTVHSEKIAAFSPKTVSSMGLVGHLLVQETKTNFVAIKKLCMKGQFRR